MMPDGAAPMMPTSQPIGSVTVQPAPATEMPMPEDAGMPLITTMMPDGAAPMMPTSQPIGSATVQPAPTTEMPMPEDADMPLITTMMPDGAAPMMPTSQAIDGWVLGEAGQSCLTVCSFSGRTCDATTQSTINGGPQITAKVNELLGVTCP